MAKNNQRKVGKISNEEMAFIRNNISSMTDSQIAEELNRSVDFVEKYRKKINPSGLIEVPKQEDVNDAKNQVKKKLRDSFVWGTLKKEFSTEELNYFSEKYVEYMAQFKNDLYSTEEAQVVQVIKFEVLMSRELISRKVTEEKIQSLEEELEGFPPQEDLSDQQATRKSQVETMIGQYRANSVNAYRSYNEFETKKEKLLESLKATRDKRISKIDSIKVSWIDIIKKIENQESRDLIGTQLAIGKKAYEKEFNRLSNPHTFTNGTTDQLILNSETYNEQIESDNEKNKGSKSSN